MKVIILAAGTGSRLRPFTENTPKCLFRLGKDETIIEHTIDIVKRNIDGEICVVTGFKHASIRQLVSGVTFVYNPFYQVTNSIASLWFAREYLDDDLILINSDIVFQESLFKEMLQFDRPAFVVLDSSKISEADYKVAVYNGKVVMMSKDLSGFTGEYVGITKLCKDAALSLRHKIETMIANEQIDEWYETALVSMILHDDFSLYYYDVPQFRWTEVDTVNDFLEAKRIYEMERLENE